MAPNRRKLTADVVLHIGPVLEGPAKKVALFDFDGTLVKPREARPFPADAEDWAWWRPNVPSVVQKYAADGWRVVIVTDQTKTWKLDMILQVAGQLALPSLTVLVGVQTPKPSPDLFRRSVSLAAHAEVFMVGDAAGRAHDWSDRDRAFATALGVRFLTPEEAFRTAPPPAPASPRLQPAAGREVVLLMGYPGSGKSTLARETFSTYVHVEGDALKTPAKMLTAAKKAVAEGRSVVVDATHPTRAHRAKFIEWANAAGLPARIVWVDTPIETAMERNAHRAAEGGPNVPKIAFYVYRKKFEEPTAEEGAEVVRHSI